MKEDRPVSEPEWQAKKERERGQALIEYYIFCVALSLVFGGVESVILTSLAADSFVLLAIIMLIPAAIWLGLLAMQRRRLTRAGIIPFGAVHGILTVCVLIAFCVGLTFGGLIFSLLYAALAAI